MLHGMCYVIYMQANQHPDQDILREQAQIYLQVLMQKN